MLLENMRIVVTDPASSFCGREGVVTRVKMRGPVYADWRPIGCTLKFQEAIRVVSRNTEARMVWLIDHGHMTNDEIARLPQVYKIVNSNHILQHTTIYFNPEDVRVLN